MQWTIAKASKVRCNKKKLIFFFAITKISESKSGGDAGYKKYVTQLYCFRGRRSVSQPIPGPTRDFYTQGTLARESSAHEELLLGIPDG